MTVSLLLMAGHFGVPFFYLMGRDRQAEGMRRWPSGERGSSPCTSWTSTGRSCRRSIPKGSVRRLLDVAAFLAVGGCFVAAASWLMRRQALVPLRDPRLAESLAFENV